MQSIPTIAELQTQVLADLQTEYGDTIPPFGKVMLYAFSWVQSAKLKLYYLRLGLVQKNIAPDTADPAEFDGTLDRWGLIKLDRPRLPATQGMYTATVTGSTGGVIDVGTQFVADDSSLNPGYLFIVDDQVTLSGSSGSIALRALTAGVESRLAVGNTLTAAQPMPNVNSTATITVEDTAPTDPESVEEYRERILESFQLLPQGGAAADYRLWGKTNIAGVSEIYPYTTSGADNEVTVYVEATIADSDDGKGTPGTTILNAVRAAIEAKMPLTIFALNVEPVEVILISIAIPSSNFTTPEQALIETALAEYLETVRPFIAGADVVALRRDTFGANNIIGVVLDVVPGAVFGTPVLYLPYSPPTPVSSHQFVYGEIPWLIDVTFS